LGLGTNLERKQSKGGRMKPRLEKARQWAIVEKANPIAVHGLFMSRESAERFLADTVPDYCRRGFYMDKTLTPESFIVREY
jgi:hypothetical protein